MEHPFIPRPDWRAPLPRQPLWKKVLTGLIEVLAVFAGFGAARPQGHPLVIPPMMARMRIVTDVRSERTEVGEEVKEKPQEASPEIESRWAN